MQLFYAFNLSLLCVAILAPSISEGIKFGNSLKIFDYHNYLRRFKKSYGPADDSNRNKLFLGRTMGIFQHNIKFLERESNYYLAQSPMMDLTADEIKVRHGQNPDLKPVREAKELGDLPANYLDSIQKLTDDVLGDVNMELDDLGDIRSNGLGSFDGANKDPESGGMQRHLDNMQEDYMSIANSEKRSSDAKRANVNLQINLDRMQENYMTPEVSDLKKLAARASTKRGQTKWWYKIFDRRKVASDSESIESIMTSFSNSVTNLLIDEPIDEIISSFSESVQDLLAGAGERDEKFSSDVSDVMSPKVSTSPIKYKIDWRITDCISKPKAQGACNACYIFATLDLLEYFYCRQTKTKLTFSSQHILDCGRELGVTKGCGGGRMSEVGRFIRTHGLILDSDLPFTGKHGECMHPKEKDGAIATNIIDWQLFDSITAWYTYVRKSPILVGIGMPADFHIYGGGIHDGQNCDTKEFHAMLLVGSGVQNGIEFWLLKNSFSEDWGEKGYFRISKSAKLNCFGSAIVARATFTTNE